MAIKVRRPPKRLKNPKPDDKAFRLFWRIVDGAVRDAFNMHPEYLARTASEAVVRRSVNKRVVGALMGFAVDAAKGRSE